MPTDPAMMFTSQDRFERITRAEVAEILNSGLDVEVPDHDRVTRFQPDDDRLTDEVCYDVVNEWSNNGNPWETLVNVLVDHPELVG